MPFIPTLSLSLNYQEILIPVLINVVNSRDLSCLRNMDLSPRDNGDEKIRSRVDSEGNSMGE